MIVQITFNLEVPGERLDDVNKIINHRISKMPTFLGFTLPGGLQDFRPLSPETEEEVEIINRITITGNY